MSNGRAIITHVGTAENGVLSGWAMHCPVDVNGMDVSFDGDVMMGGWRYEELEDVANCAAAFGQEVAVRMAQWITATVPSRPKTGPRPHAVSFYQNTYLAS